MDTQILATLSFVLLVQCLSSSNTHKQDSKIQKLPDYIAPCYRDDPMLSECVRSSTLGIIRKVVDGIPELDIPSLDPIVKDEIDAFDVAGFRLKLLNITIRGASRLRVVWNSASMKTKQYRFHGEIDSLELNANYELSGHFLFNPIRAAGSIYTIGRGIQINQDAIMDIIIKHGVEFLEVRDVRVRIYINDGSLWIGNLGPFEHAINSLLNNRLNMRFILNNITPILEQAASRIVEELTNRIFTALPYDVVVPKGTGKVHPTADEPHGVENTLLNFRKLTFFKRIMSDFD